MDSLLNFYKKDLKQNCEHSAKIANKPSNKCEQTEVRTNGRCLIKTKNSQNVWGEENVPENALSRKFLDPSKRASGLLCRGYLYRKNRALTPEGDGKRTVRGVQNPFLGGVSFVRFFPLFSTPPWRPLMKQLPCKNLLDATIKNTNVFRQRQWLVENRPCLRERSWIFSSEIATTFLIENKNSARSFPA